MTNKTRVAVVGAGKIGSMILELLSATGDYEISVYDASQEQLDLLINCRSLDKVCLDVTDEVALSEQLAGHFAVLSATPFYMTSKIAKAAVLANVHYLDLTEDVASTEIV